MNFRMNISTQTARFAAHLPVIILPNSADDRFVFGLFRFTLLKILKNSARNSRLWLSLIGHDEFLEGGEIDIRQARPAQRVPAHRAERAWSIDCECIGVKPACNLFASGPVSRECRIANDVGAVQSDTAEGIVDSLELMLIGLPV